MKDLLNHIYSITNAIKTNKTIQIRNVNHDWVDLDLTEFPDIFKRIRVKPEKLEAWVNVYSSTITTHPSKEAALQMAREHVIRKAVHVIEIKDK